MKVVSVIAVGGVLGAAGRYGVAVALPTSTGAWPWSTLAVNATGCLLIGVLMVLVDAWRLHRLVRPFLGVGLLGGYTTFSTYAVDAQALLAEGRPALALGYLLATPVVALLAVQIGVVTTRAVIHHRGGTR
ncbi:MAG TPA: CrcB family protein [Actinomycetales bacterium]|nr:CrcB family protein [Actinomycetales bacterium]